MSAPKRTFVLLALACLAGATLFSTSNAQPNVLHGYPEGSYVMENGDIAIPLRSPPLEIADDVMAKLRAASDRGLAYDIVEDREVELAGDSLFIRPGAQMMQPSGCTMNFIYGAYPNFKIGSAGHCNAKDQEVILRVGYPAILLIVGITEVSHNNGVGDDWSIVSVYPQWQGFVDTDVADVWGPEGGEFMGNIVLSTSKPTKHIGHGMAIGTGGTPREGVAHRTSGSWWACACAAIFGDSGSPMLVVTPQYPMGQALGVLTHLVVGTNGPVAGTLSRSIPYDVADGDGELIPDEWPYW